jgi:hypothetical protein
MFLSICTIRFPKIEHMINKSFNLGQKLLLKHQVIWDGWNTKERSKFGHMINMSFNLGQKQLIFN